MLLEKFNKGPEKVLGSRAGQYPGKGVAPSPNTDTALHGPGVRGGNVSVSPLLQLSFYLSLLLVGAVPSTNPPLNMWSIPDSLPLTQTCQLSQSCSEERSRSMASGLTGGQVAQPCFCSVQASSPTRPSPAPRSVWQERAAWPAIPSWLHGT